VPNAGSDSKPRRENSESELQQQRSSLAEWGARISSPIRPRAPGLSAEDRGLTYRKLGVGPRPHTRTRNQAPVPSLGDQLPLARARFALSWQASLLMARGEADMAHRPTLDTPTAATGS
jgi:hypothetical protein